MDIGSKIFGVIAILAGLPAVYSGITTEHVSFVSIVAVPFAGGIAVGAGFNAIR